MRKRGFLGLAVVALISSAVASAEADPLRLADLLREAVDRNPQILAAQKRYESARQRPGQASSLPETMLSLGYSSNGNPLPGAGLGAEPTSNAGFMVTQEFPFPGKRKLRGDIALREAEAEFQNYQQAQLQVVARVKKAYHRLHHTSEVQDLLDRQRELLRDLLRISEARYSVGRVMQQDVLNAQTQLSVLEARAQKNTLERRTLEAEINSLLNRPLETPLGRTVKIEPGEFRVKLEDLLAHARQQSPMLRAEEKMIQRSELAVNLARKEYYPDYSVSAGYFNMGAMKDMYQVRVDFKLPTSFFRKQRAMVAEQSHTLSAARRSYQAASVSLDYGIKEAFLMAENSFRLMELYRTTVLPQVRLTLESSIPAYESGGVDFLTMLTNAIAVLDSEENFHMQMLEFHLALIELEEMTGEHLIDERTL